MSYYSLIDRDYRVPSLDFTETDKRTFDFKGQPCGASHISAGYTCRVGYGGLTPDQQKDVDRAVRILKSEPPGALKEGGQNLQDPGEAKKYAKFYEEKKDLTYKAKKDTPPEVVQATLDKLRKETTAEEYKSITSALEGKGSPTKEMRAEAGWGRDNKRSDAVLKSMMDNDFKDVMGNELSWRQGLQLDHRMAGSVGGKDTPDNWIWISTASNQTKGGLEAAVSRPKYKGLSGQEKEDVIRKGLITKLNENAKMTPAAVAKVKADGAAEVARKAAAAGDMRNALPTMSPSKLGATIDAAGDKELRSIAKASVAQGKNPVTGRATSYRPVLSGGDGARVRKAYGTVPEMRSLMRMRWDQKLSPSDTKNIGNMLKKSTGSKKSRADLLDEMLGNFPRTSGLTAAERIAILDAANFAEGDEDIFDFGMTCKRKDGSLYGTSGQCRKGVKTEPAKKAKKTTTRKPKVKVDAKPAKKTGPKEESFEKLSKDFDKAKKELGEGNYGAVKEKANGDVIKKGLIGPEEREIHAAMTGVDGVVPLKSYSPKQSLTEDAPGIVVMGKAKGSPVFDREFTPQQGQKAADEYVRLSGEMHKRGIAHRDMHEQNFLFDDKTGRGEVLDFGRSIRSRREALQEAMGIGNDFQSSFMMNEMAGRRVMKGDNFVRENAGPRLQRFEQNRQGVLREMAKNKTLDNMGRVSTKVSDDQARDYINQLYDGV